MTTKQPMPTVLAKLLPGRVAAVAVRGVPQFAQNLAPAAFAKPQFGQFIKLTVTDVGDSVAEAESVVGRIVKIY